MIIGAELPFKFVYNEFVRKFIQGLRPEFNIISDKTAASDVDKYFQSEAINFHKTFDILSWWKYQSENFPDLSRLAKDIFAIPATSVPSESAFSTSGRIVDDYRTNLNPRTVESLVLGKNWWQNGITLDTS
jgi:hypothetical protein